VKSTRFDEDVQFDSIDLEKGSARVIGNGGAGDVRVLRTEIGLSLFESGAGVFDTTTVISAYTADRNFPAVDSRHITSMLGKPVAEQCHGHARLGSDFRGLPSCPRLTARKASSQPEASPSRRAMACNLTRRRNGSGQRHAEVRASAAVQRM